MTRLQFKLVAIGTALIVGAAVAPGHAAEADPTWPCVQRKVPELSIGQMWNGPNIPEAAKDWNTDAKVDDLVNELAARRNPVDMAQKRIAEFTATLPKDNVNEQLFMVLQGLFDTMNREREQILSGIARYAQRQRDMADDLRKDASIIDAMRGKSDADPEELDRLNERLTWETRIFQERVQSLSYVCEVPTIIEQRLYALSKTISQSMVKP